MTIVMDFLCRLGRPLRRARAATALLALGVLAGCGGGERASNFKPGSMLVFGDEANVINTDAGVAPLGARYTVNAFVTDTTTIDCNANLIWVQRLAAYYGFELSTACPLAGDAAKLSRIRAQAGTGVADVAAQIDAQLAERPFSRTDLVTVYTGTKDVIGLYESAVTQNSDCSFDPNRSGAAGVIALQARQRGAQLAAQVNRIANLGGRVLFVTVPNLGGSPYGRIVESDPAKPGVNRASCLGQLSDAFNAGLRTNVVQDGRLVGLVQLDERVQQALNGFIGYDNLSDAVCSAALPGCTTATLVTGATATTYTGYLWADDRHVSVTMHSLLGDLAIQRATNNPF